MARCLGCNKEFVHEFVGQRVYTPCGNKKQERLGKAATRLRSTTRNTKPKRDNNGSQY